MKATTTTTSPGRKQSLDMMALTVQAAAKDMGRVSTDAALRAKEFMVHSVSLLPKTFKLLVKEGEIILESTNIKKKGKVFSVQAATDVQAKNRQVLILPEGKRFVANSPREAQEIVNAIRSSLIDGYITAEDDDDDDQNLVHPPTPITEDDDSLLTPPPPPMTPITTDTLANTPDPLPREMWNDPGTNGFKIRSRTYLSDRVKQPAQARSLFRLAAIDLVSTDKKLNHISAHPANRVRLARERGDTTFVYTINFQIPGPPYRSFACYFVPNDVRVQRILSRQTWNEEEHGGDLFGEEFPELLRSFFLNEDDSFRDSHFKIIPRVCEGPWILKNLTPQNKPCLLAQKLKINYFRDEHGLEMDLDIGRGDILADNLTRIGCSHAKSVVVDVAFLIESKMQAELPEFLVGVMRANHVDFSFLKEMDDV